MKLLGSNLVMWQLRAFQCGVDKSHSVVIGGSCRGGEVHIMSPALWSFRMDATQDHPSFAEISFDDCRRCVRIFSHKEAPTRKLRTIFPVMLDGWRIDASNGHRCFVDTSIHFRIKAELHSRGQVQAVALGFPS